MSTQRQADLAILYIIPDVGDNAGGALDYLVASFEHVYYFSLRTHDTPARPHNRLFGWQGGNLHVSRRLPTFVANQRLQRYLVPIIYLLNAIELLAIVCYIRMTVKIRRILMFTPNPIYAAISLLVRPFFPGLRVVLWVCDVIIMKSSDVHWRVGRLYRLFVGWIAPWIFNTVDVVWYANKLLRDISYSRLPASYSPRSELTTPSFIAVGTHPRLDLSRRVTPRVGYMGNLEPQKGGDLLVQIVPLLLSKCPGLQVDIIGSGTFFEALRQLQGQWGKESIRLLGTISDQGELAAILNSWQVAIAPYPLSPPDEYFGGISKVLTYLSFHLPVVVTRLPDVPEIIHQSGAGLAVDNNARAFADGVLTVLRDLPNYQYNARRFAEEHTPARTYDPVFATILNCCYSEPSSQ